MLTFSLPSAAMWSSSKPTLRGVLTDAARVITARPRHFLVLSALFLLPNAVASIVYLFFTKQPAASIHANVHRSLLFLPQTENPQFLAPILYIILSLLLSLSATASITYSAVQGFYGKPVDLISSLKSVLVSFLPLLATNLAMEVFIILISFAIGTLAFLAYGGLSLIGFDMNSDSPYFVVALVAALLVGIIIYLSIEWVLSNEIVVVESKWGFEPLKRSSKLVKGVKGTVVLVMLVFAVPSVAFSFLYMNFSMGFKAGGISWISGLVMAVYAIVLTVMSIYSMAARAILFAYCREWNGDADEEAGYAKVSVDEDHQ